MKHSTVTALALGAALFAAGHVLGQNKPGVAAPAAAPKEPKLVRVATLSSVEANREFTKNVQVLQAQRQAAVELDAALKKEKDAKKKKELQTQLDQLVAKLNENNALMQKHYGFSLTRNYVMEIERSHIYLQVTDEEAAKIEQEQRDAKKTAGAKK